MKKIRKAVILAAGYGTRFLPVTKAIPKEMLPIIDKPIIQYIVEELVDAGIEQIVFVTSKYKREIKDHFDRHLKLEQRLKETGKTEQFNQIRKLSDLAEFVYVEQKEANGSGDAILAAKNVVKDEPFIVVYGDDVFLANPSRAKQLIKAYNKYDSVIMAGTIKDKPEDADKYGYVKGEEVENGIIKISSLIEKPGVKNRPSNLAVVSGFISPSQLFEALEKVPRKHGQELYGVDGINVLKKEGCATYAAEIKNGKYYDCGNVTEYIKTNIELALKHPKISKELKKYIKKVAGEL